MTSFTVWGLSHLHTAFSFSLNGEAPCGITHWPRNSTSLTMMLHFDAVADKQCFRRAAMAFCKCSAYSSMVREYTKMSSKNTRTKTSRYLARTSLIICMNYEGALVTPNGITKNSYKPQRVLNAVFRMSYSRIGIYQYSDFKSILLNTLAPPRRSNISSGNSKGYQF